MNMLDIIKKFQTKSSLMLIMKDKKKTCQKENNCVHFDGNICLTVDSLMKINNIITGSNNITLRKINADLIKCIWAKI